MELCDRPISQQEVLSIINLLKNNKSPGMDGLTAEFYKVFATVLAPFLHEVFVESLNEGSLPPTMTQGPTTLTPKPNKECLLIDNWHHIGLLNNDSKSSKNTQNGPKFHHS